MEQTRKLYYEDCNLRSFSAQVLACVQQEKGWDIILDATAFYPEGGGQACDTGTLDAVTVLHTREEGEQVIHLCSGPLAVGAQVTGTIHWQRRFDLMQQHTGEHMVSGLVHQLLGLHNVGFHVGKDVMEVDFDGPISGEALAQIERKANEGVWANLPVRCWVPSEAELPGVFYRTKRALPWPVRIVEIPGIDSCACCGVHTDTTGRVGLIKILSCMKFHQGVRLELVCGGRAYDYMAAIFEENRRVSQIFSAKTRETGAAAQKVWDALNAEKFRAAGLEKQVLQSIADSYVNQEKVMHFQPGLNPAAVRELAEKLSRVCQAYAAVFSGSDGEGYSYCLAARETDLRQLNRDMTAALNGRGGGKPQFQQGNVKAKKAEIDAFFAGANQNIL